MSIRVLPGTRLTPGVAYRITAVSAGDPEPSKRVGDVLTCSVNAGANELDPDWHPDFGGHWFGDFKVDAEREGAFGTLITGLEELPSA